MTHPDELPARINALLRSYGQWQQADDAGPLSEHQTELVRLLAEDRLAPDTPPHAQAIALVAGHRQARELWSTFIGMQQVIEQHMLDELQQSLAGFIESTPVNASATYGAQVIDLVARMRQRGAERRSSGVEVMRYAAETRWDTVGRGKYVAGDMAMSLVFPSMDPQVPPTGFLITCPLETVRAQYAGKRFRVLFVEPETQAAEPLQHATLEVGPFDASGEIEIRFDDAFELGQCVVPVWIDVVE